MAKVKNVSPFGDLYLPAIDQVVEAGEVVELPDDLAASLLEQPLNWIAGNGKKTTTDSVASAETSEEK